MSVMPQGVAVPAAARAASRPGTPAGATTPGPGGAGAAADGTGGGFAALVAGLVDALAGPGTGPGAGTGTDAETGTDTQTDTGADTHTDTGTGTGTDLAGTPALVDPTAVLLAALPLPQHGVTGQQVPTAAPGTTGTGTTGTADVSGVTDRAGTESGVASTPQQGGPQVAAPTPAPARGAPHAATAARPDGVGRGGETPAGPVAADGAPSTTATSATTTTSSSATSGGTDGAAVAGAAATAPSAGATPGPQATSARQVTGQVFPEVVRLAQTHAGAGQRTTQHLTLRLDPGTLGEVRVTLSLGEHGLRVRMVAAHEGARDALHQGAPELQRLLEHLGETRVSVRDTAGAPAAAAATPGGTSAQDARGDAPGSWSGSDHTDSGGRPSGDASRQQERQARTSADHIARDGTTSTAHPGSLGAGSADPQTSRAHRVLDVSM